MPSLFGQVSLLKDSHQINLEAPTGLASTYTLRFPGVAPTNDQVLVFETGTNRFAWQDKSSFGSTSGGDVTDVVVPAPFVSSKDLGVVTIAYDATLPANLVLASPTGAVGSPSMRSLTSLDIPDLDASKIATGTLGSQRMPSGTIANSWQIGGEEILQVATPDQLNLFKSDGTTFADLRVNKIIAEIEEIQSHVTIATPDTTIELNSDKTAGTPTENMEILGLRGDSAAATIRWDETQRRWLAGTALALRTIPLKFVRTFTNADLVSGVLTVTHNLNTEDLLYQVWSEANRAIGVSPTIVDNNNLSFDFTALGTIAGTWKIVVQG